MITLSGTYFDGKSSRAHEVEVTVLGDRLLIRGQDVQEEVGLSECSLEPALGQTRRTLYTPGGGRLDTEDRETFHALERLWGGRKGFRLVHWLESRWKWALAAVVLTVCLMAGFSMWGIPWLARIAAYSVPEEANSALGAGVLQSADRHFFKPSELAAREKERIRTMVARFVEETGAPEPGAFEFRVSPFGPNAFALPGDTVVITDELVSFVDSDGELMGVIAHELAHLEKRHAMRTVL